MSFGGNVEGYLIMLDGESARIVYCILDEGMLQYYTSMGGPLLGALPLTGCKVEVFLLPETKGMPSFQFKIKTQMKPVRRTNPKGNAEQPMTRAAQAVTMEQHKRMTNTLVFAGATKEVSDRWAVSILNWNRYSWEDPQTLCSSKDEYQALTEILRTCNPSIIKNETLAPGASPSMVRGPSPVVSPI